MSRHVLYAYVDGVDLAEVAEMLESKCDSFVGKYAWRATPSVVNQVHERDPTLGSDDLPDWHLGLNMELPDPGDEPVVWFDEVARITLFLAELHRTTGRCFTLGVGDEATGVAEDLFTVDTPEPSLGDLRKILGVREAAREQEDEPDGA
jgi:hypothetical protein